MSFKKSLQETLKAAERAFIFVMVSLLAIIGLGTIIGLASAIIGYAFIVIFPISAYLLYKKAKKEYENDKTS